MVLLQLYQLIVVPPGWSLSCSTTTTTATTIYDKTNMVADNINLSLNLFDLATAKTLGLNEFLNFCLKSIKITTDL